MLNSITNYKNWLNLTGYLWLPKFGSLSAKQASLQKDFDTINARLDAQALVIRQIEKDLEAIARDTQTIIKLLQENLWKNQTWPQNSWLGLSRY